MKDLRKRLREQIGMVFQHSGLFPHIAALDIVTLGLLRISVAERERAVLREAPILETVDLIDRIGTYPSHPSGGVGSGATSRAEPLTTCTPIPSARTLVIRWVEVRSVA